MFEPENKIIIIDDIQGHLDILSKPFYENGIGCKCFIYDVNYNVPLKNVRVAFFDIRINPTGGGSAGQRLNDIATAMKQYIHFDNGPFALIFWTSNKGEIDAIKKYIHERHHDCPKPFLVDFIDKDEFLDKPDKLTAKLEETLGDETLKILFEFEKVSSQSASMTINQLYEIIPRKDTWGETINFKENFEKVFSKIAVQNSGYVYAKHNPDKGVVSSLLPILNHHIENLHNSEKWKNYLTTLTNSKSYNEVTYPDDFSEGKLNSIFHIEKTNGDKEVRGTVINIDRTNQAILNSFNISNIDVWFNSLIPFNKDKDDFKRQTRSNSKLVAVEISAACDFSNNKKRINKYALGFITPLIKIKEDINDAIRTESSYNVGDANFNFEGEDFQIWLNMNFVFGTKPDDPRFGTARFVLKKEIMDMIGNRYASHVSRIGITSF
jgi:hypothetical protein